MEQGALNGRIITLFVKRDPSELRVEELLASGSILIVIPHSAESLLSRLASLTSTDSVGLTSEARAASITVDEAEARVEWNGGRLGVTRQESAILGVLLRQVGRTLRFRELLRDVWKSDFERDVTAIHTAIKRLRRKLDAAGVPLTIQSVRGIGFRATVVE